MALIKTRLEKAQDAHTAAGDRLAAFTAERAELAAKCEAEADFEAGVKLRDELAVFDRKIEAAKGALAHTQKTLADAQAAEVKAEGDRAHAAAEKRAKSDASLVLETLDMIDKLAANLAKIEEGRALIEEANAKRGDRPFITDAEKRVREIPAQTLPKITRFEEQWVSDTGERPGMFRANAAGEMVPADHRSYSKRKVEVVERAETHIPARMPERLADAVRLVDKGGRWIWPR